MEFPHRNSPAQRSYAFITLEFIKNGGNHHLGLSVWSLSWPSSSTNATDVSEYAQVLLHVPSVTVLVETPPVCSLKSNHLNCYHHWLSLKMPDAVPELTKNIQTEKKGSFSFQKILLPHHTPLSPDMLTVTQ